MRKIKIEKMKIFWNIVVLFIQYVNLTMEGIDGDVTTGAAAVASMEIQTQ